jgi:DNA-binding transcriptional LysR family regulator
MEAMRSRKPAAETRRAAEARRAAETRKPSLETRELAYFVAVAEELHFGRAAQRLGIAQPPLSRAIRQLERRLGVTLLERGSRALALTAAGEVLLRESKAALAAVMAAARRTQRAADGGPRLVLAVKPGGDGGLLPRMLAAYRRVPGAVPVEVVCSFGERAAMLRDGRADVALLYAPREDLSGFAAEELLTEEQVVVLPEGHALAGRDMVCMADLAGETMPRWPHLPAEGANGPVVHDGGQLMQLVALGQLVAVLPESVRGLLRHDLVTVPVIDAPRTTLLLAWPEDARSRALAAFVQAATGVAGTAATACGR